MAVGSGEFSEPAGGRGRFITLEGGECAGKSTQIKRLAAWLENRDIAVVTTREPGGSAAAETLRDLLLSGRIRPFGTDAEALAFAIARADHMETLVRPALAQGRWVICDRFMDSTRAYQGADGVSDAELDRLEKIAVGDDRPDLTIILDLPVDTVEQRLATRGEGRDRYEAADRARHEDRRQRFLDIANADPRRCVVIDADQSEDAVFAAIAGVVGTRFAADARSGSAAGWAGGH
ncbi:MAG: dTMP kinase [Alphaproteobacteria bacterium]